MHFIVKTGMFCMCDGFAMTASSLELKLVLYSYTEQDVPLWWTREGLTQLCGNVNLVRRGQNQKYKRKGEKKCLL